MSTDGKENFILGIDDSSLQADADRATRIITSISDSAEEAGRKIDAQFKQIDITALEQQIERTKEALSSNIAIIKANNDEVEKMSKSLGGMQMQLDNSTKGSDVFNELSSKIKATSDTIEATNANSQQLAQESDGLKGKLQELEQSYATLTESASQAGAAMNASGGQNSVAGEAESAAVAQTSAQLTGKAAAEMEAAQATNISGAASGTAAQAADEESESLKQLKEELKQTKTDIDDINKAQESFGAAKKIEEYSAQIDRLQSKISRLQDNGATMTGYDSESAALRSAMRSLDEYQQKLQQVQSTQSRLNADAEQYNATASQLKVKIDGWDDAKHKAEAYKQEAEKVPGIHEQIASTMKTIGTLTAGYLTVEGIKNFAEEVINTRKEMELMEVQFKGLMGESKGGELFSGIKEMALSSGVYDVKGLAQAAETMNVYGISVEQTMPMLKQFGDVAMGNGQKLQSLAMAFGRLESEGQLSSLTLRTLARAGFNPLDIIAQQTGKTMAQVRTEMTAGNITTEKVKEALVAATSEGGKFNNSMANISTTIAGEQGRLKTMIEETMNSIGEEHADGIKEATKFVESLVTNYETIGRTIAQLIMIYGTYRTAILVNTLAESTRVAALIKLIRIQGLATMAQKALNKAMLTNPYVLAAVAIMSLCVALYNLYNSENYVKEATKEATEEINSMKDTCKENNDEISKYLPIAKDASKSTEDRKRAIARLKAEMPSYFKNLTIENSKTYSVANAINAQNDALKENIRLKSIKAASDFKGAQQEMNVFNEELKNTKFTKDAGWYQAYDEVTRRYKMSKAAMDAYNSAWKEYQTPSGKSGKVKTGDNSNSSYLKEKAKARAEMNEAIANYKRLSKSATATVSQVQSAKAKMDATKKTYNEKFGGIEDAAAAKSAKTAATRAETAAEKERKIEEKRVEAKKKLGEEETELENQNEQRSIEIMQEGTSKKMAQINADYDKQKAEIEKKAHELAKTNAQAGIKAVNKNGLTTKQQAEIDKASNLNEAKRNKQTDEITLEDVQSMREYLKQYGTYQQQKLAIAEQYSDKIKKAQSEGEKYTLTKQRDDELKKVDETAQQKAVDDMKNAINWNDIFADLNTLSIQALKRMGQQLSDFLDTHKNMAITDAKEIAEKIQQINEQIGKQTDWFYSPTQERYSNAAKETQRAQSNYDNADAQNAIAKEDLSINQQTISSILATLGINASAKGIKSSDRSKYTSGLDTKSTSKLNTAFDKLEKSEIKATEANQKQTSAGTELQKAKQEEANASMSFSQKIGAAGESLSSFTGKLADLPGLIDELGLGGTGVGKAVNSGLNAANDAAGAMSDYASGNYVGAAMKGLSALGNVGDMLGIGGDSDKTLETDIEYLTQSNKDLQNAIESLSDDLEKSSTADASSVYSQQVDDIKQQMANTQEMMSRSGAAYSNGKWGLGIGGHKSSDSKINKGMSGDDWKRVSDAAGVSVNSASDFWNLTSEQMANVEKHATDLYSKIKNLADDGYKDAAKYMDDYIAYYKQLEDLQNAYNEKLTDVSFDNIRDEFKDTLLNMTSSTKDFADNFEDMMKDAIIESMMSSVYEKKLKEWYQNFSSDMEDGKLTKDEQDALKNSWNDIVNEGNGTKRRA